MVLYKHCRATATFGIALCSLILASCGGGGTATPPPIPSTITSVTVSPASTNVLPGASRTFQVAVQGTGAFSSAINWSVNGTSGGSAALRIINSAGVYTAPVGVNNMDPSSALDNGSAEIYGFDYSNPSHPRLVSLMGDGSPEDYVMALWASPNRLVAAGASAVTLFDLTQPRNVIGRFPFPNQLLFRQDPGSITPAAISGRGPLKPHVAQRFPVQQRQPPKPKSQSAQPRWAP